MMAEIFYMLQSLYIYIYIVLIVYKYTTCFSSPVKIPIKSKKKGFYSQ